MSNDGPRSHLPGLWNLRGIPAVIVGAPLAAIVWFGGNGSHALFALLWVFLLMWLVMAPLFLGVLSGRPRREAGLAGGISFAAMLAVLIGYEFPLQEACCPIVGFGSLVFGTLNLGCALAAGFLATWLRGGLGGAQARDSWRTLAILSILTGIPILGFAVQLFFSPLDAWGVAVVVLLLGGSFVVAGASELRTPTKEPIR
jgi:hypothetical protein